jgi:hypothetical protein
MAFENLEKQFEPLHWTGSGYTFLWKKTNKNGNTKSLSTYTDTCSFCDRQNQSVFTTPVGYSCCKECIVHMLENSIPTKDELIQSMEAVIKQLKEYSARKEAIKKEEKERHQRKSLQIMKIIIKTNKDLQNWKQNFGK